MRVDGRFTTLARESALRFLGAEPDLHSIGHGDSRTYRARLGDADYLLRLHTPVADTSTAAFNTLASIESECQWLHALDAETDLVVQRPVELPEGGHVLLLDRESQQPLPVTLLNWTAGSSVTCKRTEHHGRQLGQLVAQLHAHAKGWTPPTSFSRPQHTRAVWDHALRELRGLIPKGIATEEQIASFERFAAAAEAELCALDAGPSAHGLVHGDLHGDNYIECEGRLHAIDFGRAGFGPWLYDIAECLGHLPAPARRAFVDEYAGSQPFDDADVRTTEAYFIAAFMESLGHNAPNPDEESYLRQAIPIGPKFIDLFLSETSFLFGTA